MTVTITMVKRGGGLAVTIPMSIARGAGLAAGARVEIASMGSTVVLTPAEVPSLRQLLTRIRPGSRPPLCECGRRVGKEVW